VIGQALHRIAFPVVSDWHHGLMKAQSKDLRRKIVDAIERGMPKAQAARTFGVGISTLKRYATKAQGGESLGLGKAPGKPPKMDG
jgi:transposase